jgi:hypothetical protein
VDDGPVAPAAVHSPSGPALDAACRAIATLPPHPALAGPAWWDAGAPQRRVTHVRREALPLPLPPWPARRALDFCGELALALAPVHEAGAAHGALRPAAVEIRPDGGPLVHVPLGDAGPADDVHGLGVLLLHLLTGRNEHEGLVVAGEVGAAAETAALLQSMLAPDPAARPGSARQVAARLGEIAAEVPETTSAAPPPRRSRRRRARLATGLALLVVAGGAGAYVVGHRVGPPGPSLTPGTVSVPEAPTGTP